MNKEIRELEKKVNNLIVKCSMLKQQNDVTRARFTALLSVMGPFGLRFTEKEIEIDGKKMTSIGIEEVPAPMMGKPGNEGPPKKLDG